MTSLDELKDKWFIDIADKEAFPPQARHPGSQLQPYTDGNLVELLIDGAAIMGDFHYRVAPMLTSDDPGQCQIMVGAMGIDPVKLLGEQGEAKDAMQTLIDAAAAGVQVYYLGSGQVGTGFLSQAFSKKLNEAGGHATTDHRFPDWRSSHHQKVNVTRGPEGQWAAVVGSADFFFARWDTPDHRPDNPNRNKKGGPTHDTALKVRGPAVRDIALTITERWNDPSSPQNTSPSVTGKMPTDFLDEPIPEQGTHSVQVLRTYPKITGKRAFSWSPQGEYTWWAAYINALKQAQRYIFVEDQYFYTFHDPPYIETSTGIKRETDFVYQMGEAIKRGVDVVAIVPGRNFKAWKNYEIQQRKRAAQYLHEIAEASPDHGNFVICYLHIGGNDPVVHSKLLLVDDEYALIGSANLCERSIAFHSELQLGVIDEQNKLVRDMRLALWQEHLEVDNPEDIADSRAAVRMFQETAESKDGRLRLYPSERPSFEVPYRFLFNQIVDPYSGPERDS